MASGGTLQGGYSGTDTLNLAALNFGGSAAINLLPFSAATPALAVTALSTSSTETINIANAAPLAGGTYALLTWGSIAGTGTPAFTLGATPPLNGVRPEAYALAVSNGTLDLGVTVNNNITWTGSQSTAWDNSAPNWKISGGSTTFYTADNVTFSDSGANPANTTVLLGTTNVSPSSVTFNNSSLSYTLSGNYGIIGAASLAKSGNQTLTIDTANSYTGGTTIYAGTLKVGNSAALGASAGSVGVASGAVLDLNGTTMINTNALTLSGSGISNGGALTNSSATAAAYPGNITLNTPVAIGGANGITLGGAISGASANTLTKVGNGMLTLTGVSTYTGSTTISAGTLNLSGEGNLGGAAANYAGNIANSGVLLLSLNSDNAQTFGGIISGGGTLSQSGGLTTLTALNSYTGATNVNGGTLSVCGRGHFLHESHQRRQRGLAHFDHERCLRHEPRRGVDDLRRNDQRQRHWRRHGRAVQRGAEQRHDERQRQRQRLIRYVLRDQRHHHAHRQRHGEHDQRQHVRHAKRHHSRRLYALVKRFPEHLLPVGGQYANHLRRPDQDGQWHRGPQRGQQLYRQHDDLGRNAQHLRRGQPGRRGPPTTPAPSPTAACYCSTSTATMRQTFSGAITGTGKIYQTGSGITTFTETNIPATAVIVNGGQLIGNATTFNTFASTTTLGVNSAGTLNIYSNGATLSNSVTGNGWFTVTMTGGQTNTYISGLAGYNGTVELSGGGENKWNFGYNASGTTCQVDSGAELYVNGAGTLSAVYLLGGDGSGENYGAIRVQSALTAPVILKASTQIGNGGGSIIGSITSGTTSSVQTLTIGGGASPSSSFALSGPISNGTTGGTIALTQNVGYITSLTGSNSYTGATTISSGTLAYTGGGSNSGNGSYALSTNANGALLINTSGTVAASGITWSGSNAGTVVLQSGVLSVGSGGLTSASPTGTALDFNGGTLKSSAAMTITGNLPILILGGGGTLDSSGGSIMVWLGHRLRRQRGHGHVHDPGRKQRHRQFHQRQHLDRSAGPCRQRHQVDARRRGQHPRRLADGWRQHDV